MNIDNKDTEIDSNSLKLMKKWQQQQELLKDRHPEWSEAMIQEEMKKHIMRDAKEMFSSKSGKEYIEEMKTSLKKIEDARNRAIDGIMIYMEKTSPDAVATVLFELDCGCIRACAVSDTGEPMGEMIMVTGKEVEEDYECSACKEDGGANMERCIEKSLAWPGDESELPADEFRLFIGRQVFGDEYTLDDI